MDLSTIIIGAGAVLCFILPIALFKLSQRKKAQRLLYEFRQVASDHIISIADTWDNRYCIGIDTNSRHLLYAQMADIGGLQLQTIALSEVAKCRAISSGSPDRGGLSVHLGLTLRGGNNERELSIYNASRSTMEPAEAKQLAGKWVDIINQNLSK